MVSVNRLMREYKRCGESPGAPGSGCRSRRAPPRCSWRRRTGRKLRSARVRTSPRLLPVNVKNTMGGFVGEKDGFEAGMGLAPWKALVNRSYDAVIAEAIDDEPPQALEVRRPNGNGL